MGFLSMVKFTENVILAELSNFKIGGPAKFYFEAKSVDDVREAIKIAQENKLRIFILGAGTNILISDKGFEGLVLKPAIKFLGAEGGVIEAGAGVLISELLDSAAERSLSGLEWAGGLPGTLGGAIRGNAGAFKGETKDVIESVDSLDVSNFKEIKRSNAECRFGYRTSVFKERSGREVILSATLKLTRNDAAEVKRVIREKIDYRLARHPMEYPNIGSIFKNVDYRLVPENVRPLVAGVVKEDPFPVVPAAFLISEAGLKGVTRGGAMISPKHPNFIVNILKASAEDVKELIKLAKKEVKNKFGIELEEEVIIL